MNPNMDVTKLTSKLYPPRKRKKEEENLLKYTRTGVAYIKFKKKKIGKQNPTQAKNTTHLWYSKG